MSELRITYLVGQCRTGGERGELTCTGCGETSMDGRCPRCSGENDEGRRIRNAPPLVPTLDYLREGEYVSV